MNNYNNNNENNNKNNNNNNNPTWLIFEQSMTTGRLDCLTPAFVMVSLQMSHDDDGDDDDNDDL